MYMLNRFKYFLYTTQEMATLIEYSVENNITNKQTNLLWGLLILDLHWLLLYFVI